MFLKALLSFSRRRAPWQRQKLLKHFRRFDGAIETVGLNVVQEILETQNAFESAGARLRVRGMNQPKPQMMAR